MRSTALLLVFLALAWSPSASADAEHLYLSCSDDARIEVYAVGPKGTLSKVSKLALPGAPAPLALSPDGSKIYAALRSRGQGGYDARERPVGGQ